MASQTTLFEHSLTCRNAFDGVLDPNILETYTVSAQVQDALSEEKARFKIWAANIGALANGSASLDYRLSESQRVRMLVSDQLSIITDAVTQLDRVVRHVDTNDEESTDLFRMDSLTSTISTTSAEDNEVSLTESCLERVHNAITRLNRTAKAIRLPGMVAQSTRAARYHPLDQFGNDIIQQFENYSLQLINCYFPNADPSVSLRLARANAFRRRIFLYRRKHQDFISGRKTSLPKDQPQSSRPVTMRTESISWENERAPKESLRTRSPMSMDGQSLVQSSVGKATEFDETKFQPDIKSVAPGSSIASSFASAVNQSRFPPPPRIPEIRAEFECPYCTQLTNSGELDKRRWRRHIIKDMEPYICVMQQCKEPDTRFASQIDWVNHMRTHAVLWKCRLPHPHDPHSGAFTSEPAFDAHIHSHHRNMKEVQKTLLKRASRATDPNVFKVCPLCHVSAEDLVQSTTATQARGKTETTSNATYALKMQKHLASHLHFIASFSLPWLDEAYSDIASDHALSSAGTDPTRSSIADDSQSDPHSKKVLSIDEDLTELTFEDDDLDPDNPKNDDEWSFIPQGSYDGHETDPVLKPFMRKQSVYEFLSRTKAKLATVPCHYLPMLRNKDFYDREENLDLMRDQLLPQDGEPDSLRIFSLHGAAGLGKTQVANEFAYRYKDQFDAVLWVHADERSKALEDIMRIASLLGLVEEESADADDQAFAASLFKAWLHNPLKKTSSHTEAEYASWLLILDHVIDPDVLDIFNPAEFSAGSVLLTGRKGTTWEEVKHPYRMLESFDPDQGARFMCHLTKREPTSDELKKAILIAELVKGLPYALEHLASWINAENLTFSEFLALVQTREKGRLAQLRSRTAQSTIPAALDEYNFLESALQSIEHSTALIQVLSLMDPDRIPEHVLQVEHANPKHANLKMTDYPISQRGYDSAIAELLKYSLVTRVSPTTISVHRIVQDGVRRRMTPSRYQDILKACTTLLCAKWPFSDFTWRHGVDRWPLCEALFPHVNRVRKFWVTTYNSKDNPGSAFDFARLACDCGWYCHERGMPAESEVFNSLAQFICEQILKHSNTATNQSNLTFTRKIIEYTLAEINYNHGVVGNEIHRSEDSLRHLLKFNSMMLEELGSKQSGTDMRLGLSFNQLGCTQMLQEDYKQAERCFNDSIKSMERLQNYEKWQVSLPMINLGQVYWLTGRYDESLNILQEALRDRERKFGGNDRESFITGRLLYSLGNVYWSLERFDDSLHYHHRALAHYLNTLGTGHHRTADALVRLTAHYLRLSKYTEALELVDRAIQVYNLNSVWQAEVVRAKFWRFKVLKNAGKAMEATKEAQECFDLYKELNRKDPRSFEELQDRDLDLMVVFWSR